MSIAGDRQAFERLVLEHMPAALALAVRLTGSSDAAEELVQDALLRAARGWKTFRGESKFRTWLFRIVINCFRDQLRCRPTEDELPDEMCDQRQAGVVEQAEASELGQIVARFVSALPPRQREVLVLSTYENMEAQEISALLAISPANVYATLHAARARLRIQLAPFFVEK
jgi:RNA polymerase sigma-70 factor (ECF subfamily)